MVFSVNVRREFLNKDACIDEARRIISEGRISGMSEIQLAREIYFHALAYFLCGNRRALRIIKKHADPIDLRDGGDRLPMRLLFAASWKISKGKKR